MALFLSLWQKVQQTLEQYDAITAVCKDLFLKKTKDYGTAWRVLRTSSLTDQLFIKARRIRNIEETGIRKVEDDVENEYIGLVNYSIMALIQLALPASAPLDLATAEAVLFLLIRQPDAYDEPRLKARLENGIAAAQL